MPSISLLSRLLSTAVFLPWALSSLSAVRAESPVQVGPDGRAAALATLSGAATLHEQAMACRTLAIVGDETAVAPLAALLDSPELAAYARLALEEIDAPAATTALLAAAERLSGPTRVGVLVSLGHRGDGQAVPTLARILTSDDDAVVDAAFHALADIASDQALQTLIRAAQAGTTRPASLTAAVLVACERRPVPDALALQALPLVAPAVSSLPADAQGPLLAHVDAADYQLVLREAVDADRRLARLLSSDRDDAFRLGLQAARQRGAAGVPALLGAVETSSPGRQEPLIDALAATSADAALPVILTASRAADVSLRRVAVAGLGNWSTAESIGRLLEVLADPDSSVATAAARALARLDAAAVDEAVLARLSGNDSRLLAAAVTLAGSRGIAAAENRLFQLAASDGPLATPAVRSLGTVVSQPRYRDLLGLLAAPHLDQAATRDSLATAGQRLTRDACVPMIAAALPRADVNSQQALLEVLATLEGDAALQAIATAAHSTTPALVDTATRVLGAWSGPDAADVLVELAQDLDNPTFQARAVRGLLRSLRQFDLPQKRRLDLAVAAAAAARRPQEQRLVAEVLLRYPAPRGLIAAIAMYGNAEPQAIATDVLPIAEAVAFGGEQTAVAALTQLQEAVAGTDQEARVATLRRTAERVAKMRASEPGFVSLFDGSSLAGWEGSREVWRAEAGAIIGGSLDDVVGGGNDFLCSTASYENFELRLQFRLQGEAANGGVNIRSLRRDDGVAAGYQADLGQGYWGELYDEARRHRFLATAQLAPTLSPEWNDYRIRCEGPRIRVWLNGTLTVDYVETEEVPRRGIIALQVQAGKKVQASYRQLRIRELADSEIEPQPNEAPPAEADFTPLFDGESFDGWHGNLEWFRIEQETIIAGSLQKPIPRNEFLRTDQAYDDFELRLQFQLRGGDAANAGVQIRTAEIPDHHEVSGYQADMGNGWWGCLYDESRRNRVLAGPAPGDRGRMLRVDDWNDYRIRCEGDRVRLWINDELTVDYTESDPEIPRTGIIAVQVHSGPPTEAWYRRLRVLPLD